MATESITERAVAIYLEETELQELGLHIPVSAAEARALIVSAMRTKGKRPWQTMEVDMFTYDDSVLLLARPSGKAAECFVFEDLEALLGAAGCLPRDTPSTLLWMDGAYYLLLDDPRLSAPSLNEFGRRVDCTCSGAAHMTEHGKVLLSGAAVGDLRRYFFEDVRKM